MPQTKKILSRTCQRTPEEEEETGTDRGKIPIQKTR